MKATQERWLPVVGFERLYEVSDHGRVRSVTKYGPNGRLRPAQMMALFTDKNGYKVLTLCRDGKRTSTAVHRLVMAAFVGPRPDGKEVCHNNGNPADNELGNLRYDTGSANLLDRRKHGTAFTRRNQSECAHGHDWTQPKSVYVKADGTRFCAVCTRARRAEYVARKRAERISA